MEWKLRILDDVEQLAGTEELQRLVWPGSETDIVPLHMLVTVAHNGGIIIGGFDENSEGQERMVGFVYGFPGLYFTPDGPRPKHCSHQLGVHPGYRDRGLGFALKRAQWQMVRHQGIDLITWTFDPLLSRNAFLNITRLGGVCSTYLRNVYGEMRDGLNAGLPSDRFQVDWWVNSKRVNRRLSKRARIPLDLEHCLSAGAQIINPAVLGASGWPEPSEETLPVPETSETSDNALVLVEVPSDFQRLRAGAPEVATTWRMHSRRLFEELFGRGYLVTDFVHESSEVPRSFYVLSHGESTL